jgi:transposase
VDDGVLRWRHAGNLPPSPTRIDSPYDLDGVKRSTEWVGFKVHLTEVCSLGMPHLITNADTTAAHLPDAAHVARGQHELAKCELLPRRQLVDGSYIGSQLVLESRDKHDIELVGPAKQNSHHTRVQSGYDLSVQDRLGGTVRNLPSRQEEYGWWTDKSPTGRVSIHTKFSQTDCAKCSVNKLCTKNGEKNSRKLALLPRKEYELLAASRIEQRTPEWKQMYNKRAGIEGTFSQGVRSFGLRRSRYRGLKKTHLQNVAIACAINLQRWTDYWSGVPPAPTGTSTFARLGQWVM